MQIRAYLYLMAAAILVPVILFAGFALRLIEGAETDLERARVVRAADRVALLVDAELAATRSALRVLAASPSLARGDLDAFYEEAKAATGSPDAWGVLLDENGRMLFNTLAPSGAALPQEALPPFLSSVLAAQRPFVTELIPGYVSGRMMTAVGMPVSAGGRRYVLGVAYGAEHFRRLLAEAGTRPDWQLDILDRAGKLVASNLGSAELVGQEAPAALAAAATRSREGMLGLALRNGGEGTVAFSRLPDSGWLVAVGAPAASLIAPPGGARRAAALALVAALLGAAAVSASFGRGHARAIRSALEAASSLGRGELPPQRRSRIVEIDRLLAALRQAGSELRRTQATRDSAGSERQSQLEHAQLARQRAEEENRAKDQFLAMLGHELRNPLAPIGTAAQLLKMPDLDSHRARYAADVIGRQVEHMNRLLSDMLDVSRVTRGLVTLNLEDVDLRNIVERAVEQTRPLMEERQHRLELRLPSQAVMVRGDQTRLTQVVANLLTNSAKYTPPHGAIQLSLGSAGNEATLSVADDGEGITPDLLPRVFDLFSQGERKADRAQGGLGLGLALVRSLVQLHGGEVDASSPGSGGGSIFTVHLPLKHELAALAAPAPNPRRGRDSVRDPARNSAPPALPAALRVMLVDDNIDAAVSLSLLLEAAGDHLVSTYYDAASALEWAAFERPDVFILDIGLPDMNGYELARRLRAMPEFADTLLIALTGYGQLADKVRAREAGFDLHIAKPAEPEEILAALATVKVAGETERVE
ncbi:hybrid sensor histidine kinase/response regulator [Massilia litorea]|uniref:histidine kinase n=1 Tax=Massilia litorea TaxID=2769491 RepID=A0A7L9U1I0_9BURK|nr:ATP-binding protein [Massilia litorea]QOL48767.1 response regulator [Massilia litorea]